MRYKFINYDLPDSLLSIAILSHVIALSDTVAKDQYVFAAVIGILLLLWLHVLANRTPPHRQSIYISHE
jgi:hypothetical protein